MRTLVVPLLLCLSHCRSDSTTHCEWCHETGWNSRCLRCEEASRTVTPAPESPSALPADWTQNCGLHLLYPPASHWFYLPYAEEFRFEYTAPEHAIHGWVAVFLHVGHKGDGLSTGVAIHNSSARHVRLDRNNAAFMQHGNRRSTDYAVSFQTSWGFYGAAALPGADDCQVDGHHTFRTLVHGMQVLAPVDGSLQSMSQIAIDLQICYSNDFLSKDGHVIMYSQRLTRFDRETGALVDLDEDRKVEVILGKDRMSADFAMERGRGAGLSVALDVDPLGFDLEPGLLNMLFTFEMKLGETKLHLHRDFEPGAIMMRFIAPVEMRLAFLSPPATVPAAAPSLGFALTVFVNGLPVHALKLRLWLNGWPLLGEKELGPCRDYSHEFALTGLAAAKVHILELSTALGHSQTWPIRAWETDMDLTNVASDDAMLIPVAAIPSAEASAMSTCPHCPRIEIVYPTEWTQVTVDPVLVVHVTNPCPALGAPVCESARLAVAFDHWADLVPLSSFAQTTSTELICVEACWL